MKLSDAVHTPVVDLGLSVSPNPVQRLLQVRGERLPGDGWLALYDVLGRLQMERPVTAQGGAWAIELDLGELSGGVYFLEIAGDGWRSAPLRVAR